jgi:hypothetical protein
MMMKALAVVFAVASVVGCGGDEKAGAGSASAKADGSAAAAKGTGSAAAAGGLTCGEAFEKDQDDNGRQDGAKKSFSCLYAGYDAKSKTATFHAKEGAKKISCVNDPEPAGVAAGDAVKVEGTVDGSGFQKMYGCKVTKQ